jgi:hypothetical protein
MSKDADDLHRASSANLLPKTLLGPECFIDGLLVGPGDSIGVGFVGRDITVERGVLRRVSNGAALLRLGAARYPARHCR